MKIEKVIQKNTLQYNKGNLGLIIIATSLLVLFGIGSYIYLNSCENEQNSNLPVGGID